MKILDTWPITFKPNETSENIEGHLALLCAFHKDNTLLKQAYDVRVFGRFVAATRGDPGLVSLGFYEKIWTLGNRFLVRADCGSWEDTGRYA